MKNRLLITALIISCALVLSTCDNPWMAAIVEGPYKGPPGSGTPADPWIVHNLQTMLHVGKPTTDGSIYDGWTLDAHYKQVRDIDLSGIKWDTIGWNIPGPPFPTPSFPFTGSYDGGHRIISNLANNSASISQQGLFGLTGQTAFITRVRLENVNISVTTVAAGGVVGSNSGVVEYCSVSGTVQSGEIAGGIAGSNSGIVQNCYSAAAVTSSGTGHAGGIVGGNTAGNNGTVPVQNCYATGAITSVNSSAGGIVGQSTGTTPTIMNCYATGTVKGGEETDLNTGASGIMGNNNRVGNSVALNPQVESIGTTGRITGITGAANPGNNYARGDMLVNGQTVSGGTAANENGAAITRAQWNSASWWKDTAKFDPGVWDLKDGRLPTLKGFPPGIQNPVVK